ncbi:MAG: class I SAM-dependent methyltransferase [Chloroflexi bacterium]|nr:class I SAM-dependent methyltransferase [Chloroflexota bacterium]
MNDASARNELWDFSLRFITPTVRRNLPDPSQAVALELGCREGRRLDVASLMFDRVIGVDSPEKIELASQRSGRADGVELRVRGDDRLPVESGSIDFVYTLAGLTGLDSLQRFHTEVAEVSRVLKPGGVAMLWFGRITRLPFVVNPLTWFRGYSFSGADPALLRVQQSAARRSLQKAGLKHVALSTPLHPDTSWRLFRGGYLSYVTAVKPV